MASVAVLFRWFSTHTSRKPLRCATRYQPETCIMCSAESPPPWKATTRGTGP